MNDKFKETFREEAEELLSQLEDILLELEERPGDIELVNAAFRAIHTVKGSAGMFGFEKAGRFTHDLETLLDACRNGKRAVDKGIVDLSLRARDKIRTLLMDEDASGPFDAVAVALMEEFKAAVDEVGDGKAKVAGTAAPGAAAVQAQPEPATAPGAAAEAGGDRRGAGEAKREAETFRIRFVPAPEVFMNGTKVLRLFEELAALGELSSVPDVSAIPPLEALDPETCFVRWDAMLTTDKGVDAIKDVFIFVEGQSSLTIEPIPASGMAGEGGRRLGEILVDRGLVKPEDLGEALRSQRKLGEVLVERNVVSSSELKSALAEQEHLKRVQEKQGEAIGTSIRVASDKLDQLVDLVGELVTMQARLQRTSTDLADGTLSSITEQMDRLVSQLRDNAMGMRMLPIGSTFNKFRRVVRDLSAELGKDVDLVAVGAETELDKTVIERLNDPLVHIIRNSLDHGIEPPDQRVAAGKPPRGTVKLTAEHSGANVVITVSDDGKGMDMQAIRAKALERGIIGPQDALSESEALLLVFKPGFSTAKNVTSVSGRGVGMDVVKREIDSLGGTVSVETKAGKGSSIILKIPLTLAIIEGLLVRVSEEHFVLPLSVVEACVERGPAADGGSSLIPYRGELIPCVDLRRFFAVPGEEGEHGQVVVVNAQDARIGLAVDAVVGENQTVIKPLGRMFRDASGLSGATILGDGRVALIVDCLKLSEAASGLTEMARAS